jgi:hypothetical protein
MNKKEAESILLALDGISANLETLRSMISGMVVPEPAQIWESGVCQHQRTREIVTHGGAVRFCDDCGYEL